MPILGLHRQDPAHLARERKSAYYQYSSWSPCRGPMDHTLQNAGRRGRASWEGPVFPGGPDLSLLCLFLPLVPIAGALGAEVGQWRQRSVSRASAVRGSSSGRCHCFRPLLKAIVLSLLLFSFFFFYCAKVHIRKSAFILPKYSPDALTNIILCKVLNFYAGKIV